MKTLEQRIQEGQDPQRAIYNLHKAYEKRSSRIIKRLETIFQYRYVYFITFTIAPHYYGLNYNTYLRKIREALKSALHWILNSDYGDEGGRLHFHAVAAFSSRLDYNTINFVYKYGAVNFKPIHVRNTKGVREYLMKTFHHATKQTAGKIHFSRIKWGPGALGATVSSKPQEPKANNDA